MTPPSYRECMEQRSVASVVALVKHHLQQVEPVRVRGEVFDVRTRPSGTFAVTLVGGHRTPLVLDDLDGIRAFTTAETAFDDDVRRRLDDLAGAKGRPSPGPRGVEATGRLTWDAAGFGTSLRIESVRVADDSSIQRALATARAGARRNAHEVSRWPLRVAFLGNETMQAFHDLRKAAAERVELTALRVPMMGSGMVAKAVRVLAEITPRQYDLVVIARGGGNETDLLPFSDDALLRAVEHCDVPVLVAIGHALDHPLVEHCATLKADTPFAAGRELRARVVGARRDLEQLRDRCVSRKGSAVQNIRDRQHELTTTLHAEYAGALRRRNSTWHRWIAVTIAMFCVAMLTLWVGGWLSMLAAILTVACVSAGRPTLAIRAERRRASAAPIPRPIAELELHDPAALDVLRTLRWSRSAIDALNDEIPAAFRRLQPCYQSPDEFIRSDLDEQHHIVEQLAAEGATSNLDVAVAMELAISLANDLLGRTVEPPPNAESTRGSRNGPRGHRRPVRPAV